MKTYLAIKEATLAAEARIIKRRERAKRINPKLRESIHNHRVHEVRSEARSTHLALGFLRGRSHSEMECPLRPGDEGHISTKGMTRSYPDFDRIQQLIKKYGAIYFDSEQKMTQKFAEWRDAALGV